MASPNVMVCIVFRPFKTGTDASPGATVRVIVRGSDTRLPLVAVTSIEYVPAVTGAPLMDILSPSVCAVRPSGNSEGVKSKTTSDPSAVMTTGTISSPTLTPCVRFKPERVGMTTGVGGSTGSVSSPFFDNVRHKSEKSVVVALPRAIQRYDVGEVGVRSMISPEVTSDETATDCGS